MFTLQDVNAQDTTVFERPESSVRSYCRRIDAVFECAEGSVLADVEGREYIDFLAGAGSLNYGHNDPDMCDALIAYLTKRGITHSLDLHTAEKRRFLEVFEQLILEPRGLDHRVQFSGPTGTNAVEAALKLARKVTGRSNVVAFTNGFHGVSLGSLSATANAGLRLSSSGSLNDVSRLLYGYSGPDFDTADLLERMLEDPSSGESVTFRGRSGRDGLVGVPSGDVVVELVVEDAGVSPRGAGRPLGGRRATPKEDGW